MLKHRQNRVVEPFLCPGHQTAEAKWIPMTKIDPKTPLTPEQFRVLRQGQTEPGGSGEHLYRDEPGEYLCVGCRQPLFNSSVKYDSGTGWPSFTEALPDGVVYRDDPLYGMKRLEVVCAGCDGHLGHVFDDVDSDTLKRFCINSVCLTFVLKASE
jgi:peptide-methionine (R)-S-oxide reductase